MEIQQKFRIKTYVDGNGFLEINEMLKIIKIINNYLFLLSIFSPLSHSQVEFSFL